MSSPVRKFLETSKIRIDGGTQPRCEINEAAVAEYAEAIRANEAFPPVVVFDDGAALWLADGFHRYHATRAADFPTILVELHAGTRRDALLHGLSANIKHGLRESRADKRRKVELMLRDDEWVRWSDREIGRQCGVSDKTVGAARAELVGRAEIPQIDARTVERGGAVYQQSPAAPRKHSEGGASAEIPRIDAGEEEHATRTPAPVPHVEAEPAHSPATEPIAAPAPVSAATPPVPAQPVIVATQPAPADGEVERLRAENSELRERIERLEECLADYENLSVENAAMAAVLAADDTVAAAMAEARQYREQVRVLSERINGLMNESGAAIKQANSWKRKAEAAEKRAKAAEESSPW